MADSHALNSEWRRDPIWRWNPGITFDPWPMTFGLAKSGQQRLYINS